MTVVYAVSCVVAKRPRRLFLVHAYCGEGSHQLLAAISCGGELKGAKFHVFSLTTFMSFA